MEQYHPSDQGKLWAALSYGSFFFGLPLGIIPLVQRDDPFALYHAKQATAVWLASVAGVVALFALTFLLFFPTFGLANFVMIPLIMLFMLWPTIVAIHGLILALNGEWTEPVGVFGLGERFFGSLAVQAPRQPMTPPGQAPPPVV